MTKSTSSALSRARYILGDVRFDEGLPRQPLAYWRARDLWDLRLTLECLAAAHDRTWKRVEVSHGR